MNIANRITLTRMCMVPPFLVALLYEKLDPFPLHVLIAHSAALLIYIVAALSDIYDGMLARKYNLVTNFGQLVDPLADKLMVLTAFVSFVELQIFPAWIVILIFCREFIVTGLRTLGATQGRVIQADRWGKHKMLSQTITLIATLGFMVLRDALVNAGRWTLSPETGYWGEGRFIGVVLTILLIVCAAFTFVSGVNYLVRNRDLIRD